MDWLTIAASQGDPSLVQQILTFVWTAAKGLGGLGFVIFVHELGHFLVAKACGVKCEKFYIGFDIFNLRFCRFQWGETEYGIGALPLGGYVKMLGQDDDPRNYEKEVERSTAAGETERGKAIEAGTAAEGLTPNTTVEKADKRPVLDPRSYLAKSVPARMAIISAGVIMNVIFAVIMGAVAFKMGIKNPPAVVGATAPGSPAWMAGWKPGDKILQFGKAGKPSEQLSFRDLTKQVAFHKNQTDLDVLIRHADNQEEWYAMRPAPSDPKKPSSSKVLGVVSSVTNTLGGSPASGLLPVAVTEPTYEKRDEVVAINGKPVANSADIGAALAENPSGPLKLSIKRFAYNDKGERLDKEPQNLELVAPAVPVREVGLIMKMGPILAVRPDSPAAEAGMQKGDVITTIDGEPAGDPLFLSQKLLPKIGQAIKVGVLRSGMEQDFTLRLGPPVTIEGPHPNRGALALDGLGIAYTISNEIAAVAPGSPAADAGLKPGQTVTKYQFVANTEDDKKREQMFGMKPNTPQNIHAEGPENWSRVASAIQNWPVGTQIKFTVAVDKSWETKDVKTVESSTYFDASRDLPFTPLIATQQATSWPQAFEWGVSRTQDNLWEVLTVLDRLRTRDVSPAQLSGPFGILGVTFQVASQGIPDLLMFLTYLGANLAVINILPIPVLDGGHLVFLAYEGIRGKPPNAEWQIRLSVAGLLFLLSVMVFATAMDAGFRQFFLN